MRLMPSKRPLIKACLALVGAMHLSGCGQDPYAREISSLDLSDNDVIARMAEELRPEDRGVFKTFAIRHIATSKGFCGNATRHSGSLAPQTVGEAVAQTREWEVQDAKADRKPDPAKMSSSDRESYELRQLEDRLVSILDDQAIVLMTSAHPDPSTTDDYLKFDDQIEDLSAQIIAKRARIEARDAALD